MTRTTFSAILLAAVFVAGCASGTTSATLQGATASARAAAGAAGNGASPGTTSEPAPAASPVTAPSAAGSLPSVVSPVRPTHCPPFTANLLGCPVPYPLPVVVPPSSHARILVCPQADARDLIGTAAAVCGSGFRAGELVTITVVGHLGSTSWQSTARPDGTFKSLVPVSACRLMPIYASARGNRGSVSNAVAITAASCRLTP